MEMSFSEEQKSAEECAKKRDTSNKVTPSLAFGEKRRPENVKTAWIGGGTVNRRKQQKV
jgi:hypothetical protein